MHIHTCTYPSLIPSSILHRPFIDPFIDPSSTLHQPKTTLHRSFIDPSLIPSSILHLPFIDPSSTLHRSFADPSFIPSSILHRPFISPRPPQDRPKTTQRPRQDRPLKKYRLFIKNIDLSLEKCRFGAKKRCFALRFKAKKGDVEKKNTNFELEICVKAKKGRTALQPQASLSLKC